ncbi:TolC family protein [Flavobacterium wongokense]|uniref:TolC family protein n=1 Tax=Flavobacterium wongokense TaxID=2910674 RepID=UPI001F20E65C|nr:TolC family protein [Flavobacterium sp. WG47]MCF6132794.1 TolC family protein [Flavobacterium sp. WG47]
MKTVIYKTAWLVLALLSTHFLKAQTTQVSLKEAIELASNNNKTLSVQKLEEQRQKEITNEMRGKQLPTVALNGTVSHYFDRQVIFLPGTFAGTQNPVQDVSVGGLNTLNTAVTLQQPLISKNISRQKEVAKVDEKIEKETTEEMKSQLLLQVTKEYYTIQLMKGQLELQAKSMSRNQKALQDAKSLFAEGRALKVDTLRSYIAVENLKSSISYLKNNIDIVTARFKKLIGMDSTLPIELTDRLALEDESEKFLLLENKAESATSKRKDIQLQVLTIEKEERKLLVIKGSQLPQVSLIGQYQLQAQADDVKVSQYTFPKTSFVGLQVTVPLFSGGTFTAQARQGKLKIQQEKLVLEDLKEEVNLELSTTASNWKNAKAQLDIQKKTVEAAEMNYTINNNRYLNNLSSMLEVNDAELAYNMAQVNYLMAVYELKILTVAYEKALGLLQ